MTRRKDDMLDPRVWTCKRKQGYESERRAKNVAAHTTDMGGPPLHPYKCTVCKRWHLSKMPPEVAARRRVR